MSEAVYPREIPFRTLKPLSGAALGALALLFVLGVLAILVSLGEPTRLWGSLLFNWLFWSSLGIGMTMFAVALHLTDAQWAWSIRRFALGGAAFLPVAMLILPLLFFGSGHLFHWLHMEADPIVEAKSGWLNLGGVFARDVLGVGVLFGLAGWFAHLSLRPDVYGVGSARQQAWYRRFGLLRDWRGAPEEARISHRKMNVLGPVLGILFAVLWGIVSVDLALSLDAHFYSTMFPVAFFWAAFHGGVAATAVAVALLRRPAGIREFVAPNQSHDLGKLVFAFSVFWMYLNWGQYVVIWYGQLQVEQHWFIERFRAPYGTLSQIVVLLIFVVPFFGLLTRPPKKVPAILAFFAGLILIGIWLERYMLVMPSVYGNRGVLPLGIPEIGITLGFAALFLGCYLWFLRTFPLLPSPATLAAAEPSTVEVPVGTPAASGG